MKTLLTMLMVGLMALAFGCSRDIESKNPVRTIPDDLPVPFNVQVKIGAGAVNLSWEMPDSSEVARFRIYLRESGAETWSRRDSTAGFSITITGLSYNHTYEFAVAPVFTGGLEGDRSSVVTAEVTRMSIMIDENDKYTKDRSVTIQINAPGSTTRMKKYEIQDSASAPFVLFSGTQSTFTLSDGDGTKTVYVQLEFEDGSETLTHLSDDIILDTRARILTVGFLPAGATFEAGDTIDFFLDAEESGGEAKVTFGGTTVVLDDPDDDGSYTWSWVVPSDFTLAGGVVTGGFTDAAGNQAAALVARNLLNVATPPMPVTLAANALTSFQIDLNWSESESDIFYAYRLYRSTTASVTTQSRLLGTFTDIGVTSHTDDSLDAPTTYHYAVYGIDDFGLSTRSNVDTATTLTNQPPTAVELLLAASEDTGMVRVQWTQNNDIDFQSYRIIRSNTSGVTTSGIATGVETGQTTTSGTYQVPSGTWYFKVFVYDRHGVSTGSNEIMVAIP